MIGVYDYAIWHHGDCIFKADPQNGSPVPIDQIEGTIKREILRKKLAKLHRTPDEMKVQNAHYNYIYSWIKK